MKVSLFYSTKCNQTQRGGGGNCGFLGGLKYLMLHRVFQGVQMGPMADQYKSITVTTPSPPFQKCNILKCDTFLNLLKGYLLEPYKTFPYETLL